MTDTENSGAMPLAGIRVLDLTAIIAGPFCTTMLADMGADVVKLERADRGDDTRTATRYEGRDGHEDYFNAVNRSKKSIALDLKKPAARAAARALAEKADVVVENFKPGTAARLGMGWDDLRPINPSLVYCSISGFGQSGPARDRLALDPVIQAVSGMMSITGEPEGDPMLVGTSIADVLSGMYAAYAVAAALNGVRRDGKGRYIDLSMQAAAIGALSSRMGETLQAGLLPKRMGNENPMRVPANAYPTRDGKFMHVILLNQDHWAPFCRAVERPDWLDDPRFATPASRVANRDTMNAAITAEFEKHSVAHWSERLEAERISFAPVQNYEEALSDPQIVHRGLVRTLDHPLSGPIRVVGPPWRIDDTDTPMQSPPLLGQDTDAVLRDWLGWETPDIERLLRDGSG